MNQKKKDGGQNTPGGLLTRLKNKILTRMRIDPTRFNLIAERYAIKLNGGKRDYKSQSKRGNFLAAWNRSYMSINMFFSFLMALELKSVKITVTMITKDDEEIVVEEKATFRNENLEEKNNEK